MYYLPKFDQEVGAFMQVLTDRSHTERPAGDSQGGAVPGERESTQHSYLQSSVFSRCYLHRLQKYILLYW